MKDNFSIDGDIQKCCFMFLKQFNSMYSKFNYVNTDMLRFLFKSYCTSFYGAELWFDKMNAKNLIDVQYIAYHKSIKRMAKQSPWSSNHDACERLELPIFKHMINAKILHFI